jgi:regulator of RNase E activity RraB
MLSFLSSLFGKGNKNGSYTTEKDYQHNRSLQTQMASNTLRALVEHGVKANETLKLEYFFYTNTIDKAVELVDELKQKGFEVEHSKSLGEKNAYIVTGWTTPMPMEDSTLVVWVGEMCDLGFKHDCEFDGWGAYTTQDVGIDS